MHYIIKVITYLISIILHAVEGIDLDEDNFITRKPSRSLVIFGFEFNHENYFTVNIT